MFLKIPNVSKFTIKRQSLNVPRNATRASNILFLNVVTNVERRAAIQRKRHPSVLEFATKQWIVGTVAQAGKYH
jgi:hypothetical protein